MSDRDDAIAVDRDAIDNRREAMAPVHEAIDIASTIHAHRRGRKMAIAGLDDNDFDKDYSTGDGFDPIPQGLYDAELVKAEEKKTSAGDDAVNLQWKITGPKYANRREFQWLNVGHSKEKTRAIAKGKLKKLCKMNGHHGGWPDAEEMVGWRAQIYVSYRRDNSGEIRSGVDKIRDPEGNVAGGPEDDQPNLYHEACEEEGSEGPGPDNADGLAEDSDMPF